MEGGPAAPAQRSRLLHEGPAQLLSGAAYHEMGFSKNQRYKFPKVTNADGSSSASK